ncbi:CRISPR-associated helicase Cas3' [Actinosynnema sp. NPDC050436]|uniref:CRISPR-associated helicase Cas3' n=1 Tax=Actinosynnema sp. NPDC050436 TaxID=3155659 RepID=UPI0033F08814
MSKPWAKRDGLPGDYYLPFHLMDAAAAAYMLWDNYLPLGVRRWLGQELGLTEPRTRDFLAFLAGLHDVGKACPCFQDQWPPRNSADYRSHEQVGYLSLPTLLSDFAGLTDPLVDSIAHRIAEVVGSHHGEFQPTQRRHVRRAEGDVLLGGPAWHAYRRGIVDTLRQLIGPVPPARLNRPTAVVLSGIVVLADWIVSDTKWITNSQWKAPDALQERWDHTLRAVRKRLMGLGFVTSSSTARITTLVLVGDRPNALQRSIEDTFRPTGCGILLISAPTAAGKTAAAMVAADRIGHATGRPGLLMCLPTQVTTNAMWERARGFGYPPSPGRGRVTLSHALATAYPPYRHYCADDEALRWLNGPHRPLLAESSVVTIDQLLLAGLAIRFNMLRLFALTGKTLVIDEVHAHQPYMLAVLGRVLSWCGRLGVSVVLLSATVPAHVAGELTAAYLAGTGSAHPPPVEAAGYPGWVWHAVDGSFQKPTTAERTAMSTLGARTARIKHVRYPMGTRTSTILRYARRVREEGGCVAIICGTVPTAQKTFRALKGSDLDDTRILLLHARLPHRQRALTEAQVERMFGKHASRDNGRRPKRAILVCTPLIEQSLDLDFDLVVTDLAPIALLIQRLGRCHRHLRPEEDRPKSARVPTVVVLDPEGDRVPAQWLKLHSGYELRATRGLLMTRPADVVIPDDVDQLVQAVHDLGLSPFDEAAAAEWRGRHATTTFERGLARLSAVPAPQLIDDLAGMTHREVRDTDATTRLGIDDALVVPRWTDSAGLSWLDSAHTVRFPEGEVLTGRQISSLIDVSIRCPATWVQSLDTAVPRWKHAFLCDARVLPLPGRHPLVVDSDLGLVNGLKDDNL